MGRRVKTHHLCLQREDVFGHKRSLEGHLRNYVIGREYFGFIDVAEPQLRSNQELLTLSEGSDPVGILWLLGGIHSHVKANHRTCESGGIKGDDKIYVASLSRDVIELCLRNSCNKSESK